MRIIVAGTGYVGLVHAAVCSEFGHEVYAYDNDESKIAAFCSGTAEQIIQYVNEPGLTDVIRKVHGKHLFFSTDLAAIIEGADVIFLCLPTPPNIDGSTNLTFYDAALEEIGEKLAGRKDHRRVVVVNKSTVPIGTAKHLKSVLDRHHVENFGVASNPEFLAGVKLRKILSSCGASIQNLFIMFKRNTSKQHLKQPKPSSMWPTRCC
jgi:UDPglucose 6-dehydrogenase